jgi:hypothetical protein
MNNKRTPKTSGAQPGNTNALKHGLYSHRFRQADIAALAELDANIDQEIDALRIACKRMFEYATDIGEEDPAEGLKAFSLFANTTKTLSTLLKTKAIAAGSADDAIRRAAMDAIAAIAKDWS